jgi:predicted flap endonuclease-1-like 5' DNA nuclease
MVAAYRAARLAQRSALRSSLHQSHVARRASREERLAREHEQVRSEEPATTPPPVAPAETAVAVVKLAAEAGSVFANLVSIELAERQAEITELPPATPVVEPSTPEPAATEAVIADAAAAPAPEAAVPPTEPLAPPPTAADPAPNDPPLAEIGFGPGMLIRLSQLGMHTMADLAAANPAELRSGLGDISRLVDVETWISNARQASKSETV